MSVQLGAHWLAFLWDLKPGDQSELQEAVQHSKEAGATVFELMPPLLNEMSAIETAAALKAGGITNAVMCHFYPNGAIGDPLGSDDQYDQASIAFNTVIDNIEELRKEGITIDMIVGPSCFVLGKDYEVDQETLRSRISNFYSQFSARLRKLKIRVAIELLRDVEDKVICTESNALATLVSLPVDVYGLHFDTFHFRDRGYDIPKAIKRFGKRIFHLHANGKDRVPPAHESDDISWGGDDGVVAALQTIGYDGIATNEPFCRKVREAAPELGEGLPEPMDEPAGLQMTNDNLTSLGLI